MRSIVRISHAKALLKLVSFVKRYITSKYFISSTFLVISLH